MSNTLIARSPDLRRLRNEGYNIEVREGFLILKDVPYMNNKREVLRGTLVSKLNLAGDVTNAPDTHAAFFAGECPCDQNSAPLSKIITGSSRQELAPGVTVDHSFSAKPPEPDPDYFEKMSRHVTILSGPARAISPGVTAQTYAPVATFADDGSVFNYVETASSRAEIGMVQKKLELAKVAIVGLGGTGSYVLDLVAKTPVREIHLFDGDTFLQHNAFRAPGAPSIETLQQKPLKVVYLRDIYARMRRGIVVHEKYVDTETAKELQGMAFVFLCIDGGPAKAAIIAALNEADVPFVDTGMGIELIDGALSGILRVTTASRERREHVGQRIPVATGDANNDYGKNIQIADLNALNAALAVIKWKKLFSFYADLEHEHHCSYTTDGNAMSNSETP
jgi:ThiF family